jgi:hypothetical protein
MNNIFAKDVELKSIANGNANSSARMQPTQVQQTNECSKANIEMQEPKVLEETVSQ